MISTVSTCLLVLCVGAIAGDPRKDSSPALPQEVDELSSATSEILEDRDLAAQSSDRAEQEAPRGGHDQITGDSLLQADVRPQRHPHGALLVMDAPAPPRAEGPKIRTHSPRPKWARSSKPIQSPVHHGPANIHLLVHDTPPAPRAPGPIVASHPPPQPKFVRSSKVQQLAQKTQADLPAGAEEAAPTAASAENAMQNQDAEISEASLMVHASQEVAAAQHEAEATGTEDASMVEVSQSADKVKVQESEEDEDSRLFEEAMKEARAKLVRRPSRVSGWQSLAVLPNGQLEPERNAYASLGSTSVESDDLSSPGDVEITEDERSDKLVRARRTS